MLNRHTARNAGMSLVEVMISVTIAGFIALGAAGSAMLFAHIANAHENSSEFQRDIRNGFEQLAFDTRNANGASQRSASKFTLTFDDSSSVTYNFISNDKEIHRTEGGKTTTLFRNVIEFDLLTSSSDSNDKLTFEADEIAIESIQFQKDNGSMPDTKLGITNFTFKIRNS